MPVFISYSHQDSDFVDTLAANLVREKHHVWMDRWELNVGDSLTEKIESALTQSSAVLIVLSKYSVESRWCRRELTAGLLRELEERETLVLPIVVDDCVIPLFLRDKLYADFRKDPDKAFDLVSRSLAKLSNPTLARFETPQFHTDYSMDWKRKHDPHYEETWIIRFTFVDHGPGFPFVVLSELKLYAVEGIEKYEAAVKNQTVEPFAHRLMQALVRKVDEEPLTGLLEDNAPKFVAFQFSVGQAERYTAFYLYRKIGMDTGMDTVVHLDNNLRRALKHLEETLPGEAPV